MLKKIFSYGFIEGVAKGLNKLTLLILPFFIDTISYGKVGLLVSIETLLPLVTLLGLDRAILRYYSEKGKFESFITSIYRPVIITHCSLILFLAIIWLLGIRSVFGIEIFPDLLLIIVLVYFQGKNLLILNMLRVDENHSKYYKGRLFIQLSKFILVVGLVFFTKNYLGYIIGSIISAMIANYLFRIRADKSSISKNFYSHATFSKLFLFSWPFIFHGIASNFLGNADKFVIEKYLSMHEVGLYTLIYSLGTTISFAYIGISVFMEPMIYKENDSCKREKLLDKFTLITISIGVFMYFLIGITTQFILPHFYNRDYASVLGFIPIVASAYLVFPFYLKGNYRLIYEQKSRTIAIVSILTSVLNIILNLILIPIYGIYAGIVTTVISFIIQGMSFVVISNKFKNVKEILDLTILSALLITFLLFKTSYYIAIIPLVVFTIYLYLSGDRLIKISNGSR